MILALALATAAAAQQLPTVFGLQLGAPVTLPECKKPSYSESYDMSQDTTCQGLPGVASRTRLDQGFVIFSLKAMPQIIGATLTITRIIDGKLEAFDAATLSHNVSRDIVDQLSAKFGKPTISGPEMAEVQKIAVPSTWARWDRPGYRVEYHAIGAELDYGTLVIETDKARALREARESADSAQRTPL